MPYTSPIIGHCDGLGNARCLHCHERAEAISNQAITADNSACHDDFCEGCGRTFAALLWTDSWQPLRCHGSVTDVRQAAPVAIL